MLPTCLQGRQGAPSKALRPHSSDADNGADNDNNNKSFACRALHGGCCSEQRYRAQQHKLFFMPSPCRQDSLAQRTRALPKKAKCQDCSVQDRTSSLLQKPACSGNPLPQKPVRHGCLAQRGSGCSSSSLLQQPKLLPVYTLLLACFLCEVAVATPTLRLFGSSPESGSWTGGLASRWGAERAIQDVKQYGVGFDIEVSFFDDTCSRQGAIKNLIREAGSAGDEPFHAILGSGCSPACVGLAELSPIWSMPTLSWGCSSPGLSDTSSYPYFTRTELSGTMHTLGFVMIVKYFNWQRLGCLNLREDTLFFVTLQTSLTEYLESSGLDLDVVGTYYYEYATSDSDLRELTVTLADLGTRIVVLSAYEGEVARSLCAFQQEGFVGSHWVFMSYAWFSTNWLSTASTNCQSDDLLASGTGMLLTTSGTWSLDDSLRTLLGEVPMDLKEEYYAYMAANSSIAPNDYTAFMYDGIWTLALAMQSYLVSHPSALDDTPDAVYLENFTATIMAQDFIGVTGRVHFDELGDRIGSLEIRQMDASESMNLKGSCTFTECMFVDVVDFGLAEPWNPDEPTVLEGRVPSSDALTCDEDLILDAVSNACVACPTGKVLMQVDLVKSCACEAGSNSSVSDSADCSACPPGRYASTPGIAGSCTACAAGSYTAETGSTGCTRCPAGSWQDSTASSSCLTCPSSKSTRYLGADSRDLCLCPIGTIAVPQDPDSCAACGEGMDCTTWNTTVAKSLPSYMLWEEGEGAAPGLPGVFECSAGESRCPGGVMGSCAEGRHGLLCAECDEGLLPRDDGTCGPCTAAGLTTAVIFVCILVFGLLLLYAWCVRRRTLGGEYTFFVVTFVSIMLTFCQTLAVLDMLAVEWGSPLDEIFGVMRIFIFDVELVQFGCVASMSEVSAYTLWVLMLPLMTVFVATMAGIHSLLTGKRQLGPLQAAAGSLNSLAFISYAALILSIFQCEGHPSGVLTVRSRSSVICWTSSQHKDLLVVGSIFLLWPVSFLSLCVLAVYQLPQQLATGNLDFLRSWEFLFGRFRHGCQWFCLVVFFRGLLLSLVSIFTDAAIQIVIMQIILVSFHTMTCTQRPWRTRIMDVFDRTLISPALIMTLVVAPFFVDDTNTKFIVYMPFAALLSCLVCALALSIMQLALYMKRFNRKPFDFFLCHHKVGAGSFARLLKMRLKSSRRIRGDVWLDSDNLTDMNLLLNYVQQAETCVALCSDQLLLRPWCVGELTTAFDSKTRTVLVLFPNFAHPDQKSIERFETIVPDISKLVAYGIDLPKVQSMLSWFPSNESVSLELPLHHNTVSTLAKNLTAMKMDRFSSLRAITTERTVTQASTSSSLRAILVDTESTEAVANAFIIAMLLSTAYVAEPSKVPEVLLAQNKLQGVTKKVIVLCSGNCFRNANVMNNLVMAARQSAQSLPIITEEEFRFPSEGYFQELEAEGLPNCEYPVSEIVPIIRNVFQEIAIVLKPSDYSTTEAILAVRGVEISRRLDGVLSALDAPSERIRKPAENHAGTDVKAFASFRQISKPRRGGEGFLSDSTPAVQSTPLRSPAIPENAFAQPKFKSEGDAVQDQTREEEVRVDIDAFCIAAAAPACDRILPASGMESL